MKDKEDLNYWKANAEEDYLHTPISVLRYITELETAVKNCSIPDVRQQREVLNRFFDWEDMMTNGKVNDREQNDKYIDEFLKSI